MSDGIVSLLILLAWLLIHALLTLAYAALANSKHPVGRGQSVDQADAPPRLHITYQLCVLLVRFAIASLAVTAFAERAAQWLEVDNAALETALVMLITLLPTGLLTLIFGDLVPEAIASRRADQIAPYVATPMRVLVAFFKPLVSVLLGFSKAIASMFGGGHYVNVVTEEEIMTMLDAGEKEGSIENEEKEMIESVLAFGDLSVREIMIPRMDVVALDIEATLDEAVQTFLDTGYSRVPVYEDNIDTVKGLLYAKDVLRVWGKAPRPIKDLMRKATFVPESKRADDLLKEMQSSKMHIVIIVDEYGGTAGLVTFEDLIEEIIGDIQDEFDLHEEAEYVRHTDHHYTVDAAIGLNDFNDLFEVEISNEDNDTLGGYLFTHFGRVPEVGETLVQGDLTLRIESLDGLRIRKVKVTRQTPANPDSQEGNSN